MCKVFTESFEPYFICDYNNFYTEEVYDCALPFVLFESVADYSEYSASCSLFIDDDYNIFLPMNENVLIEMAPLPKAVYLLFLRHPEGISLKKISEYSAELESIYRMVSQRKNPSVIHRLISEVSNPASNLLNKNLSIIRAAFLRKLPSEVAQLYFPIRNRGRKQYVLLDASCIKLPEILCRLH